MIECINDIDNGNSNDFDWQVLSLVLCASTFVINELMRATLTLVHIIVFGYDHRIVALGSKVEYDDVSLDLNAHYIRIGDSTVFGCYAYSCANGHRLKLLRSTDLLV